LQKEKEIIMAVIGFVIFVLSYIGGIWALKPSRMGYYDNLSYWVFALWFPVLGIIFWYIFFYPAIRRW